MLNYLLKAKYSFISALVFFIVANPETFKLTNVVFGSFIPMTPTNGLILHTVLFFFAMWGLMLIPSL